MTKREKFLELMELVKGNEEMVSFIENEIALLDKKAKSNENRKAKRNAEHEELENNIKEVLSSVGIATTNEIAMELGLKFQKITPRLKAMAERNEVTRKQIKKDILWELAE